MNKELTIIIVLYNSTNLIFECLQSLNNFNIIIVDNGKNKHLLKKLNSYQNIKKIIKPKKNLGFGNGVNLAFNDIETDFFLVLNPDIILNENSIYELLKISKNDLNCEFQLPIFQLIKMDIQCCQNLVKVLIELLFRLSVLIN